MVLNYIATCYPPSAVSTSVSCNFTSEAQLNLIVAKFNLLEIYAVSSVNLMPLMQITVNGLITNLVAFRKKYDGTDALIMLTDALNFSILDFDILRSEIRTKCSGDINDNLHKCEEGLPIVRVDPNNSYALVRVFNGVLKIVSIDYHSKSNLSMYNIRLNELYLLDVVFLAAKNPHYLHIGIIYKDQLSRHFRSYLIRTRDMELKPGPHSGVHLDEESAIIIPNFLDSSPFFIVSNTLVLIFTKDSVDSYSPPELSVQNPIILVAQIARKRVLSFLLADSVGNLYSLLIEKCAYVTRLGTVNIPSSLTYLDNGVVFVGSALADSQLIRLDRTLKEGDNFTILDTFLNIGPIIDMELYDRSGQNVPQLITCSGTDVWGSLRVLTHGVQVDRLAHIPTRGFNNVFALKLNNFEGFDDCVLLSSTQSTVALLESNNEFTPLNSSLFQTCSATMTASNVAYSQILQITKNQIRLIDVITQSVCQTLDGAFSHSSCNGFFFGVSSFNEIVLYAINPKNFQRISSFSFQLQISCFSISRLPFLPIVEDGHTPNVLAVSFWNDYSVNLYSLPDFQLLSSDKFDLNVLFRSIKFANFKENSVHLLCGSSSGDLYVYELSDKSSLLKIRTKAHLGSWLLRLSLIQLSGATLPLELVPGHEKIQHYPPVGPLSVVGCSDRVSILNFNIFKIVYSYTDVEDATGCCSFYNKNYPNSFLIMSPEGLYISKASQLCNYNILTVPIYESPQKIVYQFENSCFGLLALRYDKNSAEIDRKNTPFNRLPYSLRVTNEDDKDTQLVAGQASTLMALDQDTYEPFACHRFSYLEVACGLCNFTLGGKSPYFAVGTGISESPGSEANSGAVYLFQVIDKKLTLIADYSANGCVFNLISHNSKLVCAASHALLILEVGMDDSLVALRELANHVTSLFCKSIENRLVVGDLIRCLSVYDLSATGEIQALAKSSETNWVTAIEPINSDYFLYGNMDGYVYIAEMPKICQNSLELHNLELKLFYNLGQQINVFNRAELFFNGRPQKSAINNEYSIMFGTVSGMIGVLMDIPEDWMTTMTHLQESVLKNVSSVGDIDYKTWRLRAGIKYEYNNLLIDGDLLDRFLQLYPDKLKEIVSNIPTHFKLASSKSKYDRITAFIGDLSRYH